MDAVGEANLHLRFQKKKKWETQINRPQRPESAEFHQSSLAILLLLFESTSPGAVYPHSGAFPLLPL